MEFKNKMKDSPTYPIASLKSNKENFRYGFGTTSGNLKIVEHSFVEVRGERKVYNLGFGDYNIKTGAFVDDEVFNNGDARLILNSVLSTVPNFFQNNPDDALIVQGSDSSEEFSEKCKSTCKKKCNDQCKKQHQRIRIYCNYLDKNFEKLIKIYIFFGLPLEDGSDFEQYIPGKSYKSVLIYKKK
ncbi:hypothetical protein JYB64_06045 [Algoriphagus aestuarii]|nr:hypothetical protein [Algoriphagus aestuarii]